MAAGGWEHLNKRCPNKRCDGELFVKATGPMERKRIVKVTHLAVKCSKGDFEKRDRESTMESWIRKQAPKREDDD